MENINIIKKINVDYVGGEKINAIVEVNDDFWIQAQEKEKQKAFMDVKVNGFRKGTVPENIAKNYVNSSNIFYNAINNILPVVFETLLKKERQIRPFFQPHVHVEKFSTTNLVIKFEIFTLPKTELCDYKNINDVKYPKIIVTKEEIDNSINELLNQKSEYVSKNAPAENGDQIVFDFEGFIDGKNFDGGKAEKYELVLGSKRFIPGFEDQLIGVKNNEKKEVNVVFPADYHVDNLKGKKAVFHCFIHDVKKKVVPELNDENIVKFNIEGVKTKGELIEHQKRILTENKNREADFTYFRELMDYITKNSKVIISEEFILKEVDAMKNNISQGNNETWNKYLSDTKKSEKDILAKFHKEAQENITRTVIFETIAETEKITVTDEDVNNEYEKMASLYKMDVEKIKGFMAKNLSFLKMQIINKKMQDLLIKYNKKV
ncbi:MAG: trigger factor [Bacilli bacterium]|nr:trigger factor [Bacilli bacterium]